MLHVNRIGSIYAHMYISLDMYNAYVPSGIFEFNSY